MAITVKIEPQTIQPVYNEIIMVLSSDKSTETDFQFRTDINSEGILLSRLKHSVNPDDFGVIDLHRHLENEVSVHLPFTGLTTFQKAPNNYTIYDVDLAEIYRFFWDYNTVSGTSVTKSIFSSSSINHHFLLNETVFLSGSSSEPSYSGSSLVTNVPNDRAIETSIDFVSGTESNTGKAVLSSFGTTVLTSSTEFSETKYAFNGVANFTDFNDWSYTTYLLTGNTSHFLTSLPTGYTFDINDQMWLSMYNGSGGTVSGLEIVSDNGKFFISNPFSASTDETKFLTIGVAPANLNNSTSNITTISGTTPIVSTSGQYTIQTVDVGSGATSQLLTFNIVSPCSKYETFRMIFLDRLGSLLSVTFNKVSRKNVTITKTNYRQNYGKYDSVNNTWGYNDYDRGKKRLDTIVRDRITVTSDWVNEEVGSLIAEMIESSEVYHLDENGNFLAVDILITSYEELKRINDKLINYTIDFEYSFINASQRG